MRPNMIFIFIAVLAIYFLGNFYVYSRGLQALDFMPSTKVFSWTFWIMALSFMVGQFLERGNPGNFERVITYIGSIWLVILWYALLMVIAVDLVRLLNHWFHFIPANITETVFAGKWMFTGVAAVALALAIGGYINALNPRINKISIDVAKQMGDREELKIALLTDIHMGAIIQNHRVKKMVRKINSINPDLILFAGDLVDHNPKPVIKRKMGEHLLDLKPELGMYAVAGNHEFIGHPEVSIGYLTKYGITYLRDTMVTIGGVLNLAGRDDKDKPRFADGEARRSMSDILNGKDERLPLILMDHQPVEYANAKAHGVDLMVSGHTHKGQFWPFNYITNMVYENHYGLLIKEATHFYTSSGFGTWGPPVRIGNRPEIVEITMRLKK